MAHLVSETHQMQVRCICTALAVGELRKRQSAFITHTCQHAPSGDSANSSLHLQICEELIQASVSHPWAAEHQQARHSPTLSAPLLLHMLGASMRMERVLMMRASARFSRAACQSSSCHLEQVGRGLHCSAGQHTVPAEARVLRWRAGGALHRNAGQAEQRQDGAGGRHVHRHNHPSSGSGSAGRWHGGRSITEPLCNHASPCWINLHCWYP